MSPCCLVEPWPCSVLHTVTLLDACAGVAHTCMVAAVGREFREDSCGTAQEGYNALLEWVKTAEAAKEAVERILDPVGWLVQDLVRFHCARNSRQKGAIARACNSAELSRHVGRRVHLQAVHMRRT